MSGGNPVTEKVQLIRWRMAKEKLRFSDEVRIIPGWAMGLAVVLFACLQVLGPILNARKAHPLPHAALIAVTTLGGLILVIIALLIGYVNRDAKRREMSPTLWTLLVIFVPNLIGFILYFLLREPLRFNCPECGATVSARFNYCPSCKFNLRPTCPQCKREVRVGDRYCPSCAYELGGLQSAAAPPPPA